MKKIILLAASLLLISSCSVRKTQEETRKITVSGSGTVNVDQMILNFTITNQGLDLQAAKSKNMETALAIKESLGSLSEIDAKDITSTEIKVDSEKTGTDWVQNETGEWVPKDRFNYKTSSSVQVLLKNVTLAKPVKNLVLSQNKDRTVSVTLEKASYSFGDLSSSIRQARSLAVQNAQDSANFLAGASGCKVNKVLEIQEGKTESSSVQAQVLLNEISPGAVTADKEGTVSVKSNITITYTLVD
ncbi:MAG: SIMPL domain-containing protein [Treponema sp.]|nr:SIMPL domain-containing protein [Treponema sp.]